jgi:nucleoside-diphosphate-sugar epimerase
MSDAVSTLILGSSGWIGKKSARRFGSVSEPPISSQISMDEFKNWISQQNADVFLNCIGKTSGSTSEMEWANVGVVELLLDHAKRTDARVINLGSAAEYGKVTDQVLDENLVPNPISDYGRQKLVANQMVNEFVVSGGSGVATRIFNVVGHGQTNRSAIGDVIARMKELGPGSEVTIDNHDIVRDYISIDFVVDVLAKLRSSSFSGTLNIGSGKPTVFLDLLNEIGLLLNTKVVPGNLFDDRIPSAVAGTERLKSLGFGWESQSLQELANMVTGK